MVTPWWPNGDPMVAQWWPNGDPMVTQWFSGANLPRVSTPRPRQATLSQPLCFDGIETGCGSYEHSVKWGWVWLGVYYDLMGKWWRCHGILILNIPSGNQTAMENHPFIDFPATITSICRECSNAMFDWQYIIWLVVFGLCLESHVWDDDPQMTHIFRMVWNHQ